MIKKRYYFLSPNGFEVLSLMLGEDEVTENHTQDKLIALREVKEKLERKLRIARGDIREEIESREVCPDCSAKLKTVYRSSSSCLSQDQFDAVKAGDYWCPACTDKTTKSGFKYFWKNDLGIPEGI
jgi:uncharacterized protein (UPF0212 family)